MNINYIGRPSHKGYYFKLPSDFIEAWKFCLGVYIDAIALYLDQSGLARLWSFKKCRDKGWILGRGFRHGGGFVTPILIDTEFLGRSLCASILSGDQTVQN
ncbi:hypothetical protein VNO77_33270 [Canavalia gladiata]|uniref:Uncharacterized protein n=1 Tax=Canavalia gladiata TaxID=3824 RepID=A0AAN9KC30_CANGL